MTTAIKTHETENSLIEIKLTRKMYDDTVGLYDGGLEKTVRKIYESYDVKITSKKNGQKIHVEGKPGDFAFFKKVSGKNLPAGAYARIGDAYIGQNVYELCMAMIAELDAEVAKTDEQIAIETAAAERKAAQETYRNTPKYRRETEEMEAHERLMRAMDDPKSDY